MLASIISVKNVPRFFYRFRKYISGKTQNMVAENVGKSIGFITNFERGKNDIGIGELEAIGKALGLKVEIFVTGSDGAIDRYTSLLAEFKDEGDE